MPDIKIKGMPCFQRERLLISGSISATDLIRIYEVDEWRRGKPINEQGCQRPPIKSHYQRLGRTLKEDVRTLLPTSITLSATEYDEGKNDHKNTIHLIQEKSELISIRIPHGHKLKIVDGQHRVLGLRFALQELKATDLTNFHIPFVLVIVTDRIDEIKMFYDINTKGKKVKTDLALQLLNDWNNSTRLAKLTKAETWKLVALNVAMKLNDDPNSIWYKLIKLQERDEDTLIQSSSFVASLHPVLHSISFVRKIWETETDTITAGTKIAALINNFWNGLKIAVPEVFPPSYVEKDCWHIQKFVGANIWHMAMPFIIEECMVNRLKITDLTAQNIADFIMEYGGYGVDDATVVWETPNVAEGISGGEAAEANGRKDYLQLSKQIIDDIQENYIGTDRADVKFA